MNNKEKIQKLQDAINHNLEDVYQTFGFPNIFETAQSEDKHLRKQVDKTEYKKFDEDWIVKIESFFPSLNQIISNIRNTLKYEEEILPVERTRRTSNESIRHILRNTKYIKDINEDDEVYPSKVLNTVSELDYGIYENRLIMTLIDRLYHYLHRRIEAINQHIHGYRQSNVLLKNEFMIGEAKYHISFELNAKETFDSSDIDEHNKRILERTASAFKVVSRMYHSDFMRIMMRHKKVVPPILKTQMIQKNPDFRNAYTLWLYLDRLNVLDYHLQLQENEIKFNKDYIESIDKSLMMIFSTIYTHSNLGRSVFEEKVINFEALTPPKIDVDAYANKLNVHIPLIELESNKASEYHLEKAKQIFGRKEITKSMMNNSPENTNYLKQVLLDQYGIADQIFNAYLSIDQDDDVFSRLIQYKHPVKKYEEALNKYFITKAARQVKEKLLSDSIHLEEKWINELTILQEAAMDSIIRSGEKIDSDLIEQMNKTFNKEIAKFEKSEIATTKNTLTKQRVLNNKQLKDLREKHAAEIKAYRTVQNERMKAEKQKIAEHNAIERKRIKEREHLKRQKEREKLIKEKQLMIKKLKDSKMKTKKDIRTKTQASLNKEKLKK